jgi:uncharacterized membrane protein
MHSSARCSISISTRAILAVPWGMIVVFIIAAPFLASHSCHNVASVLYYFFFWVCHQIPERSFMLSGFPLAVCHRCTGIYLGMFIGCFIENNAVHGGPQTRRLLVAVAILPLGIDALMPMTGVWTNNVLSRFSTGLLFGILISSLVVHGFAEFMQDAPWRRLIRYLQLKGDLS